VATLVACFDEKDYSHIIALIIDETDWLALWIVVLVEGISTIVKIIYNGALVALT